MLFLLASALAASFAINLPPSEAAADWGECLAIAGLVASSTTIGPRVEVIAEGERWRLRAQDGRGSTREVVVAVPRTPGAREDVAFLAASLVRPMAQVAASTPPPPAVAPVVVTPPAPATVAPPAPRPVATTPPPVVAPAPVVTTPPADAAVPATPAPVATTPVPVAPPETSVATVATPEPTPADWWIGLGASGSAAVRVDSEVAPAVGGRFEAGSGDFGASIRVSWAAPATVTALESAPRVAETTLLAGPAWLPGPAALGARAGVALVAVSDAGGGTLGELVAAPALEIEGGWRLRPVAPLVVEPFLSVGVVTRKVSLLTVAEGKSTLEPWRVRAGVAVYFFAGRP